MARDTGETDLIDISDIETPFEDDVTEPPGDRTVPSEALGYESEDESGAPVIAEIRDRFAAFFLDVLFLYILYWPAMLAYRTIAFESAAGPIPARGIHGIIFNGLFLLLALLWFVLPEMVFQASPGKLLCHLIIRKADGSPAPFISVLLRNLLRPIDIILFPVLILSAMLEWTAWHRRLGDFIGGTVVVRKLVNIPKQYALSLEIIATATRRAIAFLIDFALLVAFIFGYGLLLNPENPVLSLLLVVFFPPALVIFFALPEWLFKTSPGKWILGLTICHEEGAAIDLPGALIRTLWRPFDNNPMGFLTILLSIRHQRPGDVAASSVVIKVPREMKGFIGVVLWSLMTAIICYAGLGNRDSFLTSGFQINFLPSIDLAAISSPAKESRQMNLSIQNFTFAEGEDRAPRRPSIFEPGETVFMIFDVDGYATRQGNVWIQEDLTINYPDGGVGLRLENINDFHQGLKKSGYIRFENNISLPDVAQPGRYSVTITIRDKLSNRDLKEQRFFYVTPADSSPTKGEKVGVDEDSGDAALNPDETSGKGDKDGETPRGAPAKQNRVKNFD